MQALVYTLRELGHEVVPPTTDGFNVDKTARPIVFGAQNMDSIDDPRDQGSFCPPNAILFNTEQLGAVGAVPKRIFDAVKTWKNRVVWDYSQTNAAALRKLGVEHVIHCPVGYSPAMSRIEALPLEKEDIDVLFYGSVEPPQRIIGMHKSGIKVMDRGKILSDLRRAGLKVEHVFGVYNRDLDSYVARAKVVLNLHYYEGGVFEIFRCSHLLANKKCVVTEDGGIDRELEFFAKKSMCYVERCEIVETCKMLVADPDMRQVHGDQSFKEFTKTSLAESVKHALEQS
ncbi:MAG: hypothetical protein V4550_18345 [Gemmatimonadota bacterium]